MRFGCVTSEIGRIAPLADMGYDYVELLCRALAPLDDEPTFAAICDRILAAPLRPEALSGFIPPFVGLKVVGPAADRPRLRRYAETMLSRAAQVGARVLVFGSGQARTIPEGFPRARALDQLRDFLALCTDLATPRGITIVLEVLNRGETNLVNTMDEALEVLRGVGRPNLRTMVDYYHVLAERQSPEQAVQAGRLLAHAHTADADRRPPGSGGASQAAFLAALRAAGYDGRLSVECRFADFPQEAPAALAHLKTTWQRLAAGGT